MGLVVLISRVSTARDTYLKAVGFTLDNAQPDSPVLNENQLKMVVSGENIQSGLDLVTGPNPPQYLQLLNEPDGGFYNLPIYSPQEAADLVRPFLDAQTGTQYLSPAPAYPNSDWLTQFFDICQCQDRFPVILAHVYDPNPDGAIATIQNVINQFPGKTIWITEISPASSGDQGCTLDEAGMIGWMQQVLGWASQQAAIERVFWNCGEYVSLVQHKVHFLVLLTRIGYPLPRPAGTVQPELDQRGWDADSSPAGLWTDLRNLVRLVWKLSICAGLYIESISDWCAADSLSSEEDSRVLLHGREAVPLK